MKIIYKINDGNNRLKEDGKIGTERKGILYFPTKTTQYFNR